MNKLRSLPEVGGRDDRFLYLIKYYKRIASWAIASSIAPLLVGAADLAPPWPPAIIPLTSLFELVALTLIFQFLRGEMRPIFYRIMIGSTVAFLICLIIYLCLLSQFVYEEPLSRLRFVKGFICTDMATKVYPGLCPYYGEDELKNAEWEASRLWTLHSITLMRLTLVLSWIAVFSSLATALGSFILYNDVEGPTRSSDEP